MTSHTHRAFIRPAWMVIGIVAAGVGAFAWSRVGLLDLPSVPRDLALDATGLEDLDAMAQLDKALLAPQGAAQAVTGATRPGSDEGARANQGADRASDRGGGAKSPLSGAAQLVHQGLQLIGGGRPEEGLTAMHSGLLLDPDNLVLSNAYRMECFKLRRAALADARRTSASPVAATGAVSSVFPAYLETQPIALLEKLAKDHPSRETRLALALAWVDEMLLFPALEVKAPASVESVRELTAVLEGADSTGKESTAASPYYVPALFARGLNHLHRPARLVWPEADKTPPDAAAQDIARCIAVGRKFNVGSTKLQATLALALGDAYVKIGRSQNARSWWQIAQNLCRDDAIQQAVRRRYAWRDETLLDDLEAELDRARAELDAPMTDLRMMWSTP